jgi:pilus assembly protein Flp/PilA
MQGSNKMSKKAKRSSLGSTLAVLRARMATDEHGATAIEYALVASGIGAAVAATVWSLGTTTNAFYASLANMF